MFVASLRACQQTTSTSWNNDYESVFQEVANAGVRRDNHAEGGFAGFASFSQRKRLGKSSLGARIIRTSLAHGRPVPPRRERLPTSPARIRGSIFVIYEKRH